ncbi:aldehyde dehydrogenase family protein [Paraburkholderia fungorum]|uniref:aldehyde dehydrogenase family protein n=1 Tax=Paraburkholderia fungorum TaxID=134537 RepID=UPI0009F1D3CF|nr:aldehyde dehydrogenase family protein [Paraburkholderia fungorum]
MAARIDGRAHNASSNPFGITTRISVALESGKVDMNDMLLASPEIPFGGAKESGIGREGGQLGIRDYLEPTYIQFRLQ